MTPCWCLQLVVAVADERYCLLGQESGGRGTHGNIFITQKMQQPASNFASFFVCLGGAVSLSVVVAVAVAVAAAS